MGPSHSLSSIDSGDTILGAGRLLLKLWEAAADRTLPLATVAWPDWGPRLSWLVRFSCSGNLDFRCSYPRLFLMVLDWVMEWYGLSFSTVSRNAEKTRLQRKRDVRTGEEGRERQWEWLALIPNDFQSLALTLAEAWLHYTHCPEVPGETLRSSHLIYV